MIFASSGRKPFILHTCTLPHSFRFIFDTKAIEWQIITSIDHEAEEQQRRKNNNMQARAFLLGDRNGAKDEQSVVIFHPHCCCLLLLNVMLR